jgi:hypothetical protein
MDFDLRFEHLKNPFVSPATAMVLPATGKDGGNTGLGDDVGG